MSAALSTNTPAMLQPAYLQRELDRTKSEVFIGKSAAFMGSLLCSLNFHWDDQIDTAATDGQNLWWNPLFFLNLPYKTRKTVLVHELWHPARLHFLRMGKRDPRLWNIACDHRINLDLEDDGYSFEGIEWCYKDPQYRFMAEEDIYDDLLQNPPPPQQGNKWCGDMEAVSKQIQQQVVNAVVRAVNQAKAAGGAGGLPGWVEDTLNKFLAPVIPWEQLLHRWMTDLGEEDYTWSRPNRRFQDIYLPSRFLDEGRLEHLIYYQDTSGSISPRDSLRFNSEIKYCWDFYRPQKLTMVQFDMRITAEKVLEEGDSLDEIRIKGRGGTNLEPVRQHIIENKPTAAIIFSDLDCLEMGELPFNIPVIWVAIGNRAATVPFGQLIHIS